MIKRSLYLLVLWIGYLSLTAQTSIEVPMSEQHWNINANTYLFEVFKGEESIYLPQGAIFLPNVDFHNGIIEFDFSVPESRGFPGLFFRIVDDQNREEFYVRPHQSGNPDANQYTPVFNGLACWQLYHGDGYSGQIKYRFGEWHHVKLIISGTAGEVYIDDMKNPLFQIHELKHGDISGGIALRGGANIRYANFSYSLNENQSLGKDRKALAELPKNTIARYQVSHSVYDSLVLNQTTLNPALSSDTDWHVMETENTGLLNIARMAKKSDKKNTSLVKIVIDSESDQIKPLDFGYSDVAHAFLNGKTIYAGQRVFRTRDYRYLGTIGYFDTLFLDLKKGSNELIFAISENFGGWGLKAKMDDQEGITIR